MTYTKVFQMRSMSLMNSYIAAVVMVLLFSSTSAATDEQFFDMEKLAISDNPVINTGWQVYQVKCAVCHGPEGSGDGPMKEVLITKPSDLTQISKRYGGDFPFRKIYEIIDGRNAPLSHGTRAMPIWGEELAKEAAGIPEEGLIRGRIKALITYLRSIQK